MGKYDPLTRKLDQTSGDEWDASFAEIEQVLSFNLPPSARKHESWWANSGRSHSQAQGWLAAGWVTARIDRINERVSFRRTRFGGRKPRTSENLNLWDTARELTGIGDRLELEEAAVRALIQQAAAQQLSRLGGTMANATAAPRERHTA